MLHSPEDIFSWAPPDPALQELAPWRPRALAHGEWPPNYAGVYAWRAKKLAEFKADKTGNKLKGALEYYRTRPHEFIMHWMDTYDPRRLKDKWIPFVFFQKQTEVIDLFQTCVAEQESGLIEKCRDAGVTWLAVGWSVHQWRFTPGIAIGWGSRKQELVDRLGDPDSIFEKIRLTIDRLPKIFRPKKYTNAFMKCMNEDNGASITGEVGDNIGRGGRKSVYFKDESAHYEHPDLIEASLGDNTNVQIDISSVNGLGNVFHRRRKAGIVWRPGLDVEPGQVRVLVIDWADHPGKSQEWFRLRRQKAINEGLYSKFAQEVERRYDAAVENTIIPLEWIKAAVDADIKLAHWTDARGVPIDFRSGGKGFALDVADGGGDTNAHAGRTGVVLDYIEEWGERDVGVTTRRAINYMLPFKPVSCQYDSVGIGASVKSEYNRLTLDIDNTTGKPILSANDVRLVSWSAGAGVLDPLFRVVPDDDESPLNKDYFMNLKAQAWWNVAQKFWKTFNAVTNGVRYPVEELIILDSEALGLKLTQVEEELAQPTISKNTGNLKLVVDKKPDNSKSPNLADAIVMCYFPLPEDTSVAIFGTYGNADR